MNKRSHDPDVEVAPKRPRRTPPGKDDVPKGAAVILIRNRVKEVIDYTLVDARHFEILNQTKWHFGSIGYAKGMYQNKARPLSHAVHMLNRPDMPIVGMIDHINGDSLDNRSQNLRMVTVSENNRNRIKATGTTSTYYGVSRISATGKFVAQCRTNTKHLHANFNIEAHAAHQVDIWNAEHDHATAPRNNVPDELLLGFIPHKLRQKKGGIPDGICLHSQGGFKVSNSTGVGSKSYYFKSLDAAIVKRDELASEKNQMAVDKTAALQAEPIMRNDDGVAFHNVFKGGQIVGRTLVDDDTWRFLQGKRVFLGSGGYTQVVINCRTWQLHRWIVRNELELHPKLFVDHIQGDRLNNMRSNLRVVTPAQNSQNKRKSVNTSSKFMGVAWFSPRQKWRARITFDGKEKFIGLFENEEDAARARDEATKKYFGEFGVLNFPEQP